MIKNLLIDLDDTILDFHKGERVAFFDTLKHFGIGDPEEKLAVYSVINRGFWDAFERGEIDRDEVRIGRFRQFFAAIGSDIAGEKGRDEYERRLADTHFFIDGAEETLTELSSKYSLYLASNGTSFIQKKRIADSGIGRFFDKIFISEDIGHQKPEKEFFDVCLREIGNAKRNETMMIGDSISSDIMGAGASGLLSCHYRPDGMTTEEADYTVSHLSQIAPLIERINKNTKEQ